MLLYSLLFGQFGNCSSIVVWYFSYSSLVKSLWDICSGWRRLLFSLKLFSVFSSTAHLSSAIILTGSCYFSNLLYNIVVYFLWLSWILVIVWFFDIERHRSTGNFACIFLVAFPSIFLSSFYYQPLCNLEYMLVGNGLCS